MSVIQKSFGAVDRCQEALERRAQSIILACGSIGPHVQRDALEFTADALRYILDLEQHRVLLAADAADTYTFPSRTLLETPVDHELDHMASAILTHLAQTTIMCSTGDYQATVFPITVHHGRLETGFDVLRMASAETGMAHYVAQDTHSEFAPDLTP